MDSITSESDSVNETRLSSPIDQSPRSLLDSVCFPQKKIFTTRVTDPPVSLMVAAMICGILYLHFINSRDNTTTTSIIPNGKPNLTFEKMSPPISSNSHPSTNVPHIAPPQATVFPNSLKKGSASRGGLGRSSNSCLSAPATNTSFNPVPFQGESSTTKLIHSGPPSGSAYRSGNGGRNATPGNSRTWTSTEVRVQREWFKLEPHLSRMFPTDKPNQSRCPYVPRNLQEYTQHLSEIETLKANRNRRILESKEEMEALKRRLEAKHQTQDKADIRNSETLLPMPREAFDGKSKIWGGNQQKDKEVNACNRSAVLSLQTIWCDRPDVSWRESADWPTMSEMKWEGVQRVATENGKFRRFPALPRVQHAPEVPWYTVPLTKWYDLDNPWPIPNEEDIFAPTEDIADEKIPDLLNSNIVEALDIGYSL